MKYQGMICWRTRGRKTF